MRPCTPRTWRWGKARAAWLCLGAAYRAHSDGSPSHRKIMDGFEGIVYQAMGEFRALMVLKLA